MRCLSSVVDGSYVARSPAALQMVFDASAQAIVQLCNYADDVHAYTRQEIIPIMSLDQNSYNKGGMIAFMSCMVITLVFFVYITFFSGGVDLKEVSPEQEAATQTQAAAPVKVIDVAKATDPWKSSPEMIEAGHQLFNQNCSMCHGPKGMGDGPAGASLNPKPRNMVEGKWRYGGGRLGIMKVLREGSPGTSMQSYKSALTVNQRWALTHFVNSITQNKVADSDADVQKAAASLQ